MNTRIHTAAASGVLFAFLLAGCSDLNEKLPAPAGPPQGVHTAAWNMPSSTEFHGKALKANGYNSTACATCHGKNAQGGTSGVACGTCHAGYPHPSGWTTTSSSAFHGKALKQTGWDVNACTPCHAVTFLGGTSGVSCYTCHPSFPHGAGWMTNSTGFHGLYVAQNSWNMQPCQTCHGTDYAGGQTGESCKTCHTNGPESCTTCHGGVNPAPPKDLANNTATTARGVGAHQDHFAGPFTMVAQGVPCADCHTVPSTLYAPGHLDTPLPAEVPLASALARKATSGLVPVPVVSSPTAATVTCANTYCHGAWRLRSTPTKAFAFTDSVMVGAFKTPSWTAGAAEAACGTCHGLPPKGHAAYGLTLCFNCHGDVMDAAGNLNNKALHMNGKINMSVGFGGEYDWPK
jgi:predicted CxxxxCH...CXXCH cytochrome family protein